MSLQGNLREMNVADLIQHNCVEGKTARLTLENETKDLQGVVFIEDGQIMHAELEGLEGEEAVYALLAWEEGSFRQDPDLLAPSHTIHRSSTGILLEGMRRIDEGNLLSMQGPVEDLERIEADMERNIPDKTPWSDLLESTHAIDGVKGTVIAASDGIVVAHDIDANPEKEGAVIVYVGHAASQVGRILALSTFKWGRVRISEENVLVINRTDFYIGLFLDDRASPALVAAQVQSMLD
jgi:predicted regulator of Ras-like GTPase activity (Roadblock/LC7/MglB family)